MGNSSACLAVLIAIAAAHLDGILFLNPPDPNTSAGKVQLATPPFYLQHFTWWLALTTVVLAAVIAAMAAK